MTAIKDPKAMTTSDPRWLPWYLQQRKKDRAKNSVYTGPSLSLNFAGQLYEVGAQGVSPDSVPFSSLISFTRATGGGRVNPAGQLEWLGSDAPRFTYDPATKEPLGLLIEEQRTNLLLQSAALATQNVTVTAVAHTLSFYGTGTVTLSGVATGSKFGTGAYPARSTLTFTPTAGVLTLTVTGSVGFGQLEVGASASSYIPTTTAQVTRSADVVSVNTLAPWYNASEGTIVVRFASDSAATAMAVSLNNSTVGAIALRAKRGAAALGYPIGLRSFGGAQAAMTAGTSVSTGSEKVAISYGSGKATFARNGATSGAQDADAPIATRLSIGVSNGLNTEWLNGIIASVEYYPRVIDVQQASA